jgi:hypothetical protein
MFQRDFVEFCVYFSGEWKWLPEGGKPDAYRRCENANFGGDGYISGPQLRPAVDILRVKS